MREIYVLCNIGMNFQIVILFVVTTIIEKSLANECGSTTSRQDGNTATITYIPNRRFVNQPRTWFHSFGYFAPYGSPVVVFNSSSTAFRPVKYTEQQIVNQTYMYLLLIHNVAINDSGLYTVRCFTDGRTTYYSTSTTLNITRVSTQTTPSRSTTGQQTVTTPHIQTEENSLHEENDDGAMIAPVIGSVLGTLALVIACAVLLKVYQKRCKKQELKPPAGSKAKGSIIEHLLGESGSAGMTITTEEIPEYASVLPKDQRKGAETIDDGSDECPEYSNVVPKSERTPDAKNDIQTKSVCDTTEAANQLVYAELDLEHPKANTKDQDRHKDTDHVQVKISKTGNSHDNKQVAEQLEQTEYVTIDFSKTENVN